MQRGIRCTIHKIGNILARLARLELATYCLEGSCSIQLSYRRVRIYYHYVGKDDYKRFSEMVSRMH